MRDKEFKQNQNQLENGFSLIRNIQNQKKKKIPISFRFEVI